MKQNKQALIKLGQCIKDHRKRLELTQKALASLANVGPNFVGQVETGKSTAHISKVLDVLSALGLQLKVEYGKEKIKC
jgi:HTH-type transcriptional regulator/antitoxin HipB